MTEPELTLLDGVRWHGDAGPRRARPRAAGRAGPRGAAHASPRPSWSSEVWARRRARPTRQGAPGRWSPGSGRSTAPEVVVHAPGNGYRLGLRPDQVDALRLRGRRPRGRGGPRGRRPRRRAAPGPAGGRRHGHRPLRSTDPLADLVADGSRATRPVHAVCWARSLLARGDAGEALPLLEDALARDPDDEARLAEVLRAEAVGARCPGGAGALRGVRRAASRDRARRRTRARSCGDCTPSCSPRDAPGARGAEVRRVAAGRPRRRRRLRSAACSRRSRVISIVGAGRARQDPAGPPDRARWPSSRSSTSSSWPASPRPRTCCREVGDGPGRARVGDRACAPPQLRADLRARIAEQLVRAADAADPRQLRAPRRRRRRPGRVPGGQPPTRPAC